jgi:hypothetical protein
MSHHSNITCAFKEAFLLSAFSMAWLERFVITNTSSALLQLLLMLLVLQ